MLIIRTSNKDNTSSDKKFQDNSTWETLAIMTFKTTKSELRTWTEIVSHTSRESAILTKSWKRKTREMPSFLTRLPKLPTKQRSKTLIPKTWTRSLCIRSRPMRSWGTSRMISRNKMSQNIIEEKTWSQFLHKQTLQRESLKERLNMYSLILMPSEPRTQRTRLTSSRCSKKLRLWTST